MNGLSLSPQQQQQKPQQQQAQLPPQNTQQSKTIQPPPTPPLNGIRPGYKYTSQTPNNIGAQITNGRRQSQLSTNDKIIEVSDKLSDTIDQGIPAPVFAKPFKVPLQQDIISKTKLTTNQMEPPSPSPDGGKDVESILKMMTSTLEPLTKIAATPRTEIEIQQPNKPYVYANLPPFFKTISNSSS